MAKKPTELLTYTHEYKKQIYKNLIKKYPANGDRHIKIGRIDDHIPTIDGHSIYDIENWIEDEWFKVSWDDIVFQGHHKPKRGGIHTRGINFKEPIRFHNVLSGLVPKYIKANLLEQKVVGITGYSEILVASNRGKEYTVQKHPEYFFSLDEKRNAPAGSKVTALIDTKTMPWSFVEIIVEPLEVDEGFKREPGVRTVINGC